MVDIWVEWLWLNYSGDTIEHPALSEVPGGEAFIHNISKVNSHNPIRYTLSMIIICTANKYYCYLSFALNEYYWKTILCSCTLHEPFISATCATLVKLATVYYFHTNIETFLKGRRKKSTKFVMMIICPWWWWWCSDVVWWWWWG